VVIDHWFLGKFTLPRFVCTSQLETDSLFSDHAYYGDTCNIILFILRDQTNIVQITDNKMKNKNTTLSEDS